MAKAKRTKQAFIHRGNYRFDCELKVSLSIQKTTFMTRMMTSSDDQTSNNSGTMGAAVAAAWLGIKSRQLPANF